MNRRAFLQTLTGGLLAASLIAEAQPKTKTWRVGFLSGGGRSPDGAAPLPLRRALQDLGYIEPRDVVYESRWADGKQDRLDQGAHGRLPQQEDETESRQGGTAGDVQRHLWQLETRH